MARAVKSTTFDSNTDAIGSWIRFESDEDITALPPRPPWDGGEAAPARLPRPPRAAIRVGLHNTDKFSERQCCDECVWMNESVACNEGIVDGCMDMDDDDNEGEIILCWVSQRSKRIKKRFAFLI